MRPLRKWTTTITTKRSRARASLSRNSRPITYKFVARECGAHSLVSGAALNPRARVVHLDFYLDALARAVGVCRHRGREPRARTNM